MSGFDAGKVTAVPLAVALTLTWLVGDDESKNDVPGVTVPT